MFIPRRCPLCERPGPAPCPSCADDLRQADEVPAIVGVDSVAAVFAYEGAMRNLLLALKYRNRRDAIGWMGAHLAHAAQHPVDAVTWAPTSSRRAADRGYDQAELLARQAARHLRRPAHSLLRRGGRAPQTGLDAVARRTGLTFTATWRARLFPVPARVLVIDDITTTGATLEAAAAALRQLGAVTVHAVVVAHTPGPHTPGSHTPGSQSPVVRSSEHGHVATWQA